MTFQQLTYVVEISKCGSINKAAHKLFLSQSGISTAVRELEQELGIQFFVRSNRGVEFTPEGREFLGYAVSMLEQKRRIEELYGESRNAAAPVHFSVSTQRYPFTDDAFLEMLNHVTDNHYQYTIKDTGMEEVIADVYEHRADVGVIFLTKVTEKIVCHLLDSRDLSFHELAAVPPCVFVRKGHPLTQLDEVTEADLEGYPYVCFEQAQGVAVDFAEEFQVFSLKKPSKCIVINNYFTAINIIAHTDAFSTGSGLLVKRLSPPDVVTVPLANEPPIRLGWIYPKNAKLTPRVEEFVKLLDESIQRSIAYTDAMRKAHWENT